MNIKVCLTNITLPDNIENVRVRVLYGDGESIYYPSIGTFSILNDFIIDGSCVLLTDVPDDATHVALDVIDGECFGQFPSVNINCFGIEHEIRANLEYNSDDMEWIVPWGDNGALQTANITIGEQSLVLTSNILNSGIVFVYLNCVGDITYEILTPINDELVTKNICVNSANQTIHIVVYKDNSAALYGGDVGITELLPCNNYQFNELF
jgi:hypothetical protein